MEPIITSTKGGWVIFLRPSRAASERNMRETWGEQYDRTERAVLTGGIPEPMRRLPELYADRAEALASIKSLGRVAA